jgi:hypothetical protein
VPVEWLTLVVEELPISVTASFVTIPALVNTSPEIATTVFEFVVKVSVKACLSSITALFAACPIDVKQNSSKANGVVAQPFGQHTLLVPLTEIVV